MEFSIVLYEIYMVARSYRVRVADIKSLLVSALVSLETRFKVLMLVILWCFLTFFRQSVFAEAFGSGQ